MRGAEREFLKNQSRSGNVGGTSSGLPGEGVLLKSMCLAGELLEKAFLNSVVEATMPLSRRFVGSCLKADSSNENHVALYRHMDFGVLWAGEKPGEGPGIRRIKPPRA